MSEIICIGGGQHGKSYPDQGCRHFEALTETQRTKDKFSGFRLQRYDRTLYGHNGQLRHFYVFNKLKPFSKATIKKVEAFL